MAKIRKIYDEAVKPDGSKQVIYPITSTRAVYTTTNVTVDTILNEGYRFGGVVLPTDTPEFTDQRVFYGASVPGVYLNFGGISVDGGEAIFLMYDGTSWHKGIFGGAGVNNLSGFKSLESISDLPLEETTLGYLIKDESVPEGLANEFLYVWVGENGDTLGGLYQNCGQLRGASAYEVAVRNGYEGTEEEWLEDPVNGIKGVGIETIEETTTTSLPSGTNVITVTLQDERQYTFEVKNGVGIVDITETPSPDNDGLNVLIFTLSDGTTWTATTKNGTGISSITETASTESGGLNTITVHLSDNTSYNVTVKNGYTPNITPQVTQLPSGTQPTVTKSGTLENPFYTFGIPAATVSSQLDAALVVQSTGASTTNVMSQAATTEELVKKIEAADVTASVQDVPTNYYTKSETASYVTSRITDNLTTDSSTQALSAKQGKLLKEQADAIPIVSVSQNTQNEYELKIGGNVAWKADLEPTAGSHNLVESGGVIKYTKEEVADLNDAVFGILVNKFFGFTNTWGSPTQVFVAPLTGKYTITVKSTDFTVLSPDSAEYLMVDNTVVPLGTLNSSTISQLTTGYTISNIQLDQGGILELRDRMSGNVSVIIKEENTGLVYEVGLLNDKDTQPLPGSERLVKSGGVFLDDALLKNGIIANSKGIIFDTQICELPNNDNFICQLIHTLESHEIYTIRLSTDRPLTRLAIVEPIGGDYILDISNVGILKDYEVIYYDARPNSILYIFQTNSGGEKCNLSFSIGKVEQTNIDSNKHDIENVKQDAIRLKDSIQVKESVILSDNDFLLSVGDHVLVDNYAFKNNLTYLIKFQCDDSIECTELTLYNGNIQDRVTVSGKLNGKEILYTPFTNGNILRYYLIGTVTNNCKCSVEVVELQNYVTDKWELIQHRTFESTSTSNLQDIHLLYPTPFITKGNRYKVIIYFANAYVSFTQAFLNVSSNPRATEVTTQFEIPAKSNTNYVEIEFTAPYDSFRIWSTFSFSGVLSNPPVGDAYLFKIGTTEYSALEENDIKNTSRFTGFLISYSSDAATPHSGTKLMLGYSTDGLHFRKLQEPYSYDFYEEYGYELYNDLCIFKKDDYFYLTGSSTQVPVGATNVPVHIVKSKDLKTWEHHATLQFPVSSFPVDEGNRVMAIWAPEILELNGSYYLSFAVGEAENPYVEKGYLVDLNSGLTSYSNLRPYTINMDYFAYTFDNTFLYDAEKGKYFGYFLDGSVYETDSLNDSNTGEWQAIGMLPLQENGYSYMEGGTIIKYKGWYYIYGDATLIQGVETPVTQNLACFRTKDFKKYEVCFEQFDIKLRHPKIILIDAIDSAIATQLYLDSLINP